MDIRGRGAVVTGGSRGLGRELAIALAKRGGRVVVTARGENELERVAEEIRKSGGEAHAFAGDIADKKFIHPLAATSAALVGDVDILIHNASALGPLPMPLLLDTECEDFSAVLETNLLGPLRLTRKIAANMALRKRGVVVFISSDAAVSAYANWGAYGVSKAALDHLARTFAAELADSGVRFFSVDPGEMNTKMHADALPDADVATLADPKNVAEAIVEMIESEGRAPNGARLEAPKWSGK
jgi:NAD(P)-dependent dehydrogenase (short-subunit alcohol dehydrogenase family)